MTSNKNPAVPAQIDSDKSPDFSEFSPVPLPSSNSFPALGKSPTSLTPLVCDERAISRLLELILSKGGLTAAEAARRLGITPGGVRQYLAGRRAPGLMWFLRLAELAGARLYIEFPQKLQK